MGDTAAAFTLSPQQIEQARIVVVDDDALVTDSLTSFLSLELGNEPATFNDARAAAEHVAGHKIDLIISDFLMPGMDGIQLLRRVRDLQPEVPRVLLTGYADKENAIRAINDVQAFHYIEKPWDNEMLRRIVLNGLERLLLLRLLTQKIEELERTRSDLSGLKNALVRTFA